MLSGTGVSKGYGIGTAVIVDNSVSHTSNNTIVDKESEKSRFEKAVDEFVEQNSRLSQKLIDTVGHKESEIILGHNMMLKDPYMMSEVLKNIDNGYSAEKSVEVVCDSFAQIFSAANDELTRQRATDVIDIKSRLINILSGNSTGDLSKLKKGSVIVARELTPSMTAGIDKDNVVAIISEQGSKTSHAAILARAMGIPAVLGVTDAIKNISNGDTVIVNGNTGEVVINPDNDTMSQYKEIQAKFIKDKTALEKFIGLKTTTADGIKVDLFSNIGTPQDTKVVCDNDGEGVGLFRTEFMFMDRQTAPGEDEQFDAYKLAVQAMNGKPVIIRTLDIGGDKSIPYLNIKKEENPFMGFRAIRYCLKNPDFYKTQLKAILRASAYGDLSLMVPLVTGVDELRAVRSMVSDIMRELDKAGTDYNHDIKIGVMIETPSAAVIADVLASESDFFSIGTNDLAGYTLAVDRGNSDIAYLYSAFSPSVLRMIRHIISEAKKAGIPCGMCGEAASDPLMIPLLLSFGLDEFSVSATQVLATRREISRWTKSDSDKVSEYIMTLDTTEDIIQELSKIIEQKR